MTARETVPCKYSPEFYGAALTEFENAYPTFNNSVVNALRAQEYSRLANHVYLDYTGGGLYADRQLVDHFDLLRRGVFGNPHSSNPTSQAATHLNEHARNYVLRYFNASPDEYVAIFTSNASGALKLVGESYPFAPGGSYVLTFDNHNSVNGIREFAKAKGAEVSYAPVNPPELRIDANKLTALLEQATPAHHHLFAYPAQSNFSGVQHSLGWIEKAQSHGWDVLLDAAAYTPSNRLDLSQVQPDFVSLSFYKIFGYPTGIGCLLARKVALGKLQRPWFAGGTITVASVQGDGYFLAEDEVGFEDGTINYLGIPAIEIGLKHIEKIGIETIHERVRCLTGWLIENLMSLYHSNGKPLVHLYGPTTTDMRGGTIAINFYDMNGMVLDYQQVEQEANQHNMSLRTGCFCNPGASEKALGLTEEELRAFFAHEERMSFEQFILVMSGKHPDAIGAVRISVGLATNFEDVYHCLQFAETFIDRTI